MAVITLPRKISPCPIHEAIMEVRYEPKAPGEAIFGLIYSKFKDIYPTIVKQPVLQIPEAIRDKDMNLRNLPEYRLMSGDFSLLVGRRTFAISNEGEYRGWDNFYSRTRDALGKLNELSLIGNVTRIGLRYINAFEFDILEHSTLKVTLAEHPLHSTNTHIVAKIPVEQFTHTMQVVNNTEIKSGERVFSGSVIDIDTAFEPGDAIQYQDIPELVSTAHVEEKRLFFSLLTEQYLASLNPEY